MLKCSEDLCWVAGGAGDLSLSLVGCCGSNNSGLILPASLEALQASVFWYRADGHDSSVSNR